MIDRILQRMLNRMLRKAYYKQIANGATPAQAAAAVFGRNLNQQAGQMAFGANADLLFQALNFKGGFIGSLINSGISVGNSGTPEEYIGHTYTIMGYTLLSGAALAGTGYGWATTLATVSMTTPIGIVATSTVLVVWVIASNQFAANIVANADKDLAESLIDKINKALENDSGALEKLIKDYNCNGCGDL